ncbi:MAG: Smr/MutS family protein [Thermacetogeniaceae bacterium]|jgi:hypothetical protein
MKMKNCDTCGNEMPEMSMSCRFCGSHQRERTRTGSRERLRTVNIEAGMPSVEDGLARLEGDLVRAKQSGVRVVRVIHGWGSTGTGGALRDACRAFLKRKLTALQIANVIHGEDYSRATSAGRDLMNRCPELRGSERSDSQNPGITFVEFY